MPIQAVVFDIGNVLLEWHPERFYDAQIGEDLRRALFSEVDLDGMNLTVDLGQDMQKSVYELINTPNGRTKSACGMTTGWTWRRPKSHTRRACSVR